MIMFIKWKHKVKMVVDMRKRKSMKAKKTSFWSFDKNIITYINSRRLPLEGNDSIKYFRIVGYDSIEDSTRFGQTPCFLV